MHEYMVVNSFSSQKLLGNPVAVFLACDDLGIQTMQKLAHELHLSETTFVLQPQHGGDARVRIFTPVNELAFAGHPLLGTALVLALRLGRETLAVETAKGTFIFKVSDLENGSESSVAHIEMEQPSPECKRYERAGDLLDALGVESSLLPIEIYDVGPRHVFVAVADVDELSAVSPDLKALATHENMAAICFCRDADTWRMRMFSPAYGVNEDAATGSAAGPLALHLARHGVAEYGTRIDILQGVEIGRPSYMYGVAERNNGNIRLAAGGFAITVAQGKYFI